MFERSNEPREKVDAAFIKDDERLKKIEKLQEIIYNLDEKNFTTSIDKIAGIGFTSDFLVYDLARNIIRLSCFHKSKLPLLVRLVSELRDESDLVSQIEQLVDFGIEAGARPFLLSLIDSHIIDSSIQTRLVRKEEKSVIQRVIEEDNINELKEIFSSPGFDISREHEFKLPKRINYLESNWNPIEFSALCGSVACFRFLYINGAKLDLERKTKMRFVSSCIRIIHLAIAGGNVEIMTILEQEKIRPDPSCISYAIFFHRIEIFDWLVTQFPESESDYSLICISHEFVHGIRRIGQISPQGAFIASCKGGLSSLVRLLISNYHLRADHGAFNPLVESCSNGHIEIVKLLLSVPSINVNKRDASNYIYSVFLRIILVELLFMRHVHLVTLRLLNCFSQFHQSMLTKEMLLFYIYISCLFYINHPFWTASAHDHTEIVKLLLSNKNIKITKKVFIALMSFSI